jgi:hypothetical protein
MTVCRFEKGGAKEFRPVHCVDGAWFVGDPPGQLPLYGLERLPPSGTIFICEGEKATEAARSIGLFAVTSAHGSSGARKMDWSPLSGRDVVIFPDNDDPGEKYAGVVLEILAGLGPPARVKIVRLPGLPDGGDIFDYIEVRDCLGSQAIEASVRDLVAAVAVEAPVAQVGPVLRCMADVEPCQVQWLWPGRMPLGRMTLLVGRPGEGKSFLTTDMAARITTGTPWPDGADCPRGSVLLISVEDDPGDTIRPRLDAHRADVQKVHLLSVVRRKGTDGELQEVMFSLADVHALEVSLKNLPDCKLVVIDPIGSFLGGDMDAHRDNEVRSILSPIARLAEKYGPAILVVAHRRKSLSSSADDTALGARAFTGIARAVWHLSRDPLQPRRRLLLPGKNNLADEGHGLAFTIIGSPPALSWERDPVTMSADEGMSAEMNNESGPGRPADERDQAAEWPEGELADLQEHTVAGLQDAAKAAGLAWRTVQRARGELGVIFHRATFGGGYVWRLPKPATMHATAGENEQYGTQGTQGESGQ